MIVGTLVALFTFVIYSSTAASSITTLSTNTSVAGTAPTSVVDSQPSDTPTDEPTQVIVKATAILTQVPTVAPTQPPVATPVPTQAPVPTTAPTQPPTGLNGNPYGYDLNAPGKLIYSPPSDICNYFNCIASFWSHTNGYVDECVDGTYSHSGGVTGACSRHGGEAQPLYSH